MCSSFRRGSWMLVFTEQTALNHSPTAMQIYYIKWCLCTTKVRRGMLKASSTRQSLPHCGLVHRVSSSYPGLATQQQTWTTGRSKNRFNATLNSLWLHSSTYKKNTGNAHECTLAGLYYNIYHYLMIFTIYKNDKGEIRSMSCQETGLGTSGCRLSWGHLGFDQTWKDRCDRTPPSCPAIIISRRIG